MCLSSKIVFDAMFATGHGTLYVEQDFVTDTFGAIRANAEILERFSITSVLFHAPANYSLFIVAEIVRAVVIS